MSNHPVKEEAVDLQQKVLDLQLELEASRVQINALQTEKSILRAENAKQAQRIAELELEMTKIAISPPPEDGCADSNSGHPHRFAASTSSNSNSSRNNKSVRAGNSGIVDKSRLRVDRTDDSLFNSESEAYLSGEDDPAAQSGTTALGAHRYDNIDVNAHVSASNGGSAATTPDDDSLEVPIGEQSASQKKAKSPSVSSSRRNLDGTKKTKNSSGSSKRAAVAAAAAAAVAAGIVAIYGEEGNVMHDTDAHRHENIDVNAHTSASNGGSAETTPLHTPRRSTSSGLEDLKLSGTRTPSMTPASAALTKTEQTQQHPQLQQQQQQQQHQQNPLTEEDEIEMLVLGARAKQEQHQRQRQEPGQQTTSSSALNSDTTSPPLFADNDTFAASASGTVFVRGEACGGNSFDETIAGAPKFLDTTSPNVQLMLAATESAAAAATAGASHEQKTSAAASTSTSTATPTTTAADEGSPPGFSQYPSDYQSSSFTAVGQASPDEKGASMLSPKSATIEPPTTPTKTTSSGGAGADPPQGATPGLPKKAVSAAVFAALTSAGSQLPSFITRRIGSALTQAGLLVQQPPDVRSGDSQGSTSPAGASLPADTRRLLPTAAERILNPIVVQHSKTQTAMVRTANAAVTASLTDIIETMQRHHGVDVSPARTTTNLMLCSAASTSPHSSNGHGNGHHHQYRAAAEVDMNEIGEAVGALSSSSSSSSSATATAASGAAAAAAAVSSPSSLTRVYRVAGADLAQKHLHRLQGLLDHVSQVTVRCQDSVSPQRSPAALSGGSQA